MPGQEILSGRRILWIVAEDWFFRLHYMPLATALVAAGAEVHVAARVGRRGPQAAEAIAAAGITLHRLSRLDRTGINPLADIRAVGELTDLCRRLAPDLVQTVAIKPVIYGTIAARRAGVAARCAWLPGMGHAFTATSLLGRVLRFVVSHLLTSALGDGATRCLVLNAEDQGTVAGLARLSPDRVEVMAGTGVDLERFALQPDPEGPPTAAFVGRMLAEKGLADIVAASAILRAADQPVPIDLVGAPDPESPSATTEGQLRAWSDSGAVTWRGPTDDVAAVWTRTSIALLPSHREGLGMSVLEAAACGRPAIVTDVPGCRDAVVDGETGLLVPLGDPRALAAALTRLATDHDLRRRMGAQARLRVETLFSLQAVRARLIAIYLELLAGPVTPR